MRCGCDINELLFGFLREFINVTLYIERPFGDDLCVIEDSPTIGSPYSSFVHTDPLYLLMEVAIS